jgi:hypothetical protein
LAVSTPEELPTLPLKIARRRRRVGDVMAANKISRKKLPLYSRDG